MDDVSLSWMPLTHDLGLWYAKLQFSGATSKRYLQGGHPDRLTRALQRDPQSEEGFSPIEYDAAIARVRERFDFTEADRDIDAVCTSSRERVYKVACSPLVSCCGRGHSGEGDRDHQPAGRFHRIGDGSG